MNYLAIPIETKPFINWLSTSEPVGPLVVAEIPEYQFGVCPLKIEGGALVPRDVGEMATYEAEFIKAQRLNGQRKKAADLDAKTFMWSGTNYPMDAAARELYGIMERFGTDTNVLSAAGDIHEITAGNIPGFLAAFHAALKMNFDIKA